MKSHDRNHSSLHDAPWSWWRQQMPVAEHWAYFDHAAVAPLSGPAAQAVQKFATDSASVGDVVWPQLNAQVEQLRRQSASLLDCRTDEITMIPNTTFGINIVAEGWPWNSGESVVIPEGEFPSNLFPWQNQGSRGVELRVVPRRNGQVSIDDLMQHVDSSTRMIAVSWVGYASGFRVDVEELTERAHARGVLVFLDAIQGLGMYPLELSKTPVDFLAADGHKWLLGPEGAGVAMIRTEHLNRIRCGNVGWNSVQTAYDYSHPKLELRNTAARFEGGSANMVGCAALSASMQMFLDVIEQHGRKAIMRRVVELAEQLDESLRRLGVRTRLPESPARRSGILTFDIEGIDPAQLRKRALEENVVLSCRDGGIRASIHAYNNSDDLNRLVDVVSKSTS